MMSTIASGLLNGLRTVQGHQSWSSCQKYFFSVMTMNMDHLTHEQLQGSKNLIPVNRSARGETLQAQHTCKITNRFGVKSEDKSWSMIPHTYNSFYQLENLYPMSMNQRIRNTVYEPKCLLKGQGHSIFRSHAQGCWLASAKASERLCTRPWNIYGAELHSCRHVNTSATAQIQDQDKKGDSKSRKNIRKKVQPVVRKIERQATVYVIGEKLNFESLQSHIQVEQLFNMSTLPDDLTDSAIHVTSRYQPEDYPRKDIFFFSDGTVVFWNVSESERMSIVRDVLKYCVGVHPMDLILEESDSLEIQPTNHPTFLNNDVININETEEEEVLVKYTFSNALSQSVKLSVWEKELDQHSTECEHISATLRRGHNVYMPKQKILKTLGTIFAIRHSVNLGSDLLDTPDFYWDRNTLASLYQQSYNHLCVPHRIKVMNEKMSYCIQLLELIKDLESDKRHIRLEWIIILLIAFEVLLELKKGFLD